MGITGIISAADIERWRPPFGRDPFAGFGGEVFVEFTRFGVLDWTNVSEILIPGECAE
jgi:hypothetical protein